jgi:hypothetical protein
LAVGVLGKTNTARISDPFQSRGNIDAVAHQVAVTLLDHISKMNTDAKLDTALGRKTRIALDHPVLHFDGASDGVDDATELNEASVTCTLDHPSVVYGDCRIDQIAAERSQPSQSPILVGAGKPAVSDDVGGENCGEFPGLGHDVSSATT